jgi:hypothetical protein
MIESSKQSSFLIFTNHVVIARIINQTFLNISNTNKLNLRLIRASQYLSSMLIEIRIKSRKLHLISNVLFRLFTLTENCNDREDETTLKNLDSMFAQTVIDRKTSSYNTQSHDLSKALDLHLDEDIILMKMNSNFKEQLRNAYQKNSQ